MKVRFPALIPAPFAAAFAAAIVALAVLPLAIDLPPYERNLFTVTFLMVSGALAWNWLGGYLGQVSFGHAAMFGIGGFVAARLMMEPSPMPPLPAWLLGGVADRKSVV